MAVSKEAALLKVRSVCAASATVCIRPTRYQQQCRSQMGAVLSLEGSVLYKLIGFVSGLVGGLSFFGGIMKERIQVICLA